MLDESRNGSELLPFPAIGREERREKREKTRKREDKRDGGLVTRPVDPVVPY
jgi:hypothetical protein